MYLTHTEYLAYGGSVTASAYPRLEFQARMLIDSRTNNRLADDTVFAEPVKRLMFELIGLIGNNDTTAAGFTPAIKQEQNDGYSLTFADSGGAEELDALKSDLIETYLSGVRNQAGESLLLRWA
jgi:hypothetical protein